MTGDLLDVYRKYVASQGWQATIIDESPGDDGGYKNVVMEVKGDMVYSKLKWEAGVHRVQRVPATESQGRVHTSTATVAVMPECDEVDVQIDPKDIEMSTMRSGGAGGQVSRAKLRCFHYFGNHFSAIPTIASFCHRTSTKLKRLSTCFTNQQESESNAPKNDHS